MSLVEIFSLSSNYFVDERQPTGVNQRMYSLTCSLVPMIVSRRSPFECVSVRV